MIPICLKNKSAKIEVVTTDIADLAMMGFGSIRNCQLVCDALAEQYENARLTIISSQTDLDALAERRPDLVVAGIKYVNFAEDRALKTSADKIWLSQFLQDHGINFTGSCRSAIELEFDKKAAEQVAYRHGVRTAASFTAVPGQYTASQPLPVAYPLFVKPLCESDSKGIDQQSVVTGFVAFEQKVRQIHDKYQQPSLAETYLPGREFTVAILATDDEGGLSAMPVEILVSGNGSGAGFLEYSIKHENSEDLAAITDPETFRSVSELAIQAFVAIGARDFGRIDIKMDAEGVPCFLEANLLPGMNSDYSYFPLACAICQGLSYHQLVNRMIEAALKRNT